MPDTPVGSGNCLAGPGSRESTSVRTTTWNNSNSRLRLYVQVSGAGANEESLNLSDFLKRLLRRVRSKAVSLRRANSVLHIQTTTNGHDSLEADVALEGASERIEEGAKM